MPRFCGLCRLLLTSAAIVAMSAAPARADDLPIAAAYGDAYIKHDPTSNVWAIGNSGVELVVGFNASGTLVVQQLWNPTTGHVLDIDQAADTSVTLAGDGQPLTLSSGQIVFTGGTTQATNVGVVLVLTFTHRTLHTIISREYACYPGSPTIETWTHLQAPSGAPAVQVSNLIGWQLTMPSATIKWVNGLRDDNASNLDPDAFSLDGGVLDDGGILNLGAAGRSSEAFVPLVSLDDGTDGFYGGMIWSGSWQITLARSGDRLAVSATFPGTSTSLTSAQPVEFPHTFFGYADHSVPAQTEALRQFVLQGIRHGRPLQPLVTYNTWFPYGSYITQDDVDHEMQGASSLGIELFVLDAGWWAGAGAQGQGDFSSGLGSYIPDPDRFPAQLIGLAGEAHSLGMQFGLWIEPERIALSTIGLPDMAKEAWLATIGDSYDGDGETAQLCLASPDARKWLLSKITTLIDSAQPDYIKWDNNFWINCDRAGHGHGPDDGNFTHVQGLYGLLDDLRMRYPNLLIENVSGGGNRLDYGMAAYTDTAWMDDLTSPSSHVRHNLEGLASAFPPAYLLSFVIDTGDEPLAGGDLPQIVRSRTPGILGLTYRIDDLDDDVRAGLTAEIAGYKLLRDTLTQTAGSLLSIQAPVPDDDQWDVIQELSDDQRSAIIFAFKNDPDDGDLVVLPQNLLPDVTYDVQSIDNGPFGAATGGDLMSSGVDIVHVAAESTAHVIIFTAE